MQETIFQVECHTEYGEEVRVVGSADRLGKWDPGRACRMQTTSNIFPLWRSRGMLLPESSSKTVEYKYIIAKTSGDGMFTYKWEDCENRRVPRVSSDCEVMFIKNTFGSTDGSRVVKRRPLPGRRVLFEQPKFYRNRGRSVSEQESGFHDAAEDLVDILCKGGIKPQLCKGSIPPQPQKAKRAKSVNCDALFDGEASDKYRPVLIWPHTPGVHSVDIMGSLTDPPWKSPIEMSLCTGTSIWWASIEDALPNLRPGTYEFKFLINGSTWCVDPALPKSKNAAGMQNNLLRLDHRLLARVERRLNSSVSAPDQDLSSGYKDVPLTRRMPRTFSAAELQGNEVLELTESPSRHRLERNSSKRGSISAEESSMITPLNFRNSKVNSLMNLSALADSSDYDTGGDDLLYDAGVALFLELPEAKRTASLRLNAGGFYKPKDGAGEGEDAFFICYPALGVADGVGGFQQRTGSSSKAFAEGIMQGCKREVKGYDQGALQEKHHGRQASWIAKAILGGGYSHVVDRDDAPYGASTAIVTYLDSFLNKLGVACLGDSGVMVIRRPTHQYLGGPDTMDKHLRQTRCCIVFKSRAQQHGFNHPFQLSRIPDALTKHLIRAPDQPDDCLSFDVDVEEGDLILLYSDGLDDNLFDDEVLDLCDRALSPYAAHVLGLPKSATTDAELVARTMVNAAYQKSVDPAAKTPFGQQARNAGWPALHCRGGKIDDITCVAAWVTYGGEENHVQAHGGGYA